MRVLILVGLAVAMGWGADRPALVRAIDARDEEMAAAVQAVRAKHDKILIAYLSRLNLEPVSFDPGPDPRESDRNKAQEVSMLNAHLMEIRHDIAEGTTRHATDRIMTGFRNPGERESWSFIRLYEKYRGPLPAFSQHEPVEGQPEKPRKPLRAVLADGTVVEAK